jgi:hypothetical protein
MNTHSVNLSSDEGNMESRLWEYIDGFSDPGERSAIEKLIAENSEWRVLYHELLQVHQSISLAELEQPSLRFTKNVMEEIAKYQIAPATRSYINKRVIWSIGIFFITMILGSLIYAVGQIDWSVAGDTNATLGIDLDKVNFGKVFDNNFVNIFMMLNIVLGLMLLDRYLSKQKKKYMPHQ